MIPIWQMMLGVCVGLVALILTRPIAYNQEEKKRHGSESNPKYNSKPGDACTVCLCDMSNEEMTYLRCGHALHTECYKQHRQHFEKCPICRQTV